MQTTESVSFMRRNELHIFTFHGVVVVAGVVVVGSGVGVVVVIGAYSQMA